MAQSNFLTTQAFDMKRFLEALIRTPDVLGGV